MAFSGNRARQVLKLHLQHSSWSAPAVGGSTESLTACRPLSAAAFPLNLAPKWAHQAPEASKPNRPACGHHQGKPHATHWSLVSPSEIASAFAAMVRHHNITTSVVQGNKRHRSDANHLFSKPSQPESPPDVSCLTHSCQQPCVP